MKEIKKLVLIMLVVTMAFFLVACNKSEGTSVQQQDGTGTETNQEEAKWPTGDIRMIVPFSPGGSVDRLARGIAQHWEDKLGVSVIVENHEGAGGLLGAKTFLEADPDGHTFFVGIQPSLSLNIVTQGADFTLDDFAFINVEQRDYGDVLVRADSPYQTIKELVDDIHNNPGKIKGSLAFGAGTYLFGLAVMDALDLDINAVTFDGGSEQRTDLLGGHSDFAFSSAYGDMSLGDEVRVLAVASEEEFPGWPDAEPINKAFPEANIPPIGDNRFIAVHGSFAKEHPDIFEQIVSIYKETFESEEYQKYISKQGSDIISGYLGPEESKKVIQELHEIVLQYEEVLKGNNK